MSDFLLLAIETSSLHGSLALGRGETPLAYRRLSPEHRHAAGLLPAIKEMLAESGYGPRDVGVVAFSQGPGSFTGLRVAATVARMWQSATGCRVIAVPTLEAIARNVAGGGRVRPQWPGSVGPPCRTSGVGDTAAGTEPGRYSGPVAVMVDARQERVYGAVYDLASHEATEPRSHEATEPRSDEATEPRGDGGVGVYDVLAWIASLPRPCVVVGDGLKKYRDVLRGAGLDALPEEFWWPDARQVLALGRELAAAGRFCTPAQIVPLYLRPPECEEVYEQRRAEAKARRQASSELRNPDR